jgi:putative copper export protein
LDLVGLSVLFGAAWLHAWSMAPAGAGRTFPQPVYQGLRKLYLLCLVVLIASSIGLLVLRSMEMSGVGPAEVGSVLPTVLGKTHFGSMWFLRLAALFTAWVIWWATKRYMTSRLVACSLLSLAGIIGFSRSSSGHLADFGDFSIQQISDWLHLAAVSCWIGNILAIAFLFPLSRVGREEQYDSLSRLADRYFSLFGPLLAILVFTGWHNSWLLVHDYQALVKTPYGWILCAKLLLVAVLVARYVAPPEPGPNRGQYSINFLRRIRVEVFLVMAVILAVAFLIHRVPARHQAHLATLGAAGQHVDTHTYAPSLEDAAVIILATDPPEITAGSPVEITLHFQDRDGRPLQGLTITHERILHAVIIGKDLEVFAHIHPEDLGPITHDMLGKATFPLRYTFPRTGDYLLGIDFAIDNEQYSKTFRLSVAAAPVMREPKIDLATTKTFAEYQVSFSVPSLPIVAGTETKLLYVIKKGGKEVTGMTPYLGAAMHLAIVSSDLKTFIHAHGVVPGTGTHSDHLHLETPAEFGPEIEARVLFPEPGIYKIFAQFKHQGRVILSDFMVQVH